MEIIDASENQLSQILKIESECFSCPWTHEQLALQLDKSCHIFLAAAEGETVLGYVGMMHVLDEGYISNIAVSAALRRCHVADALLAALEARAREKRLSFISLEVRDSNTSARRLYEKHGFEEVGRRARYYEKPAEDAIICTKWIN